MAKADAADVEDVLRDGRADVEGVLRDRPADVEDVIVDKPEDVDGVLVGEPKDVEGPDDGDVDSEHELAEMVDTNWGMYVLEAFATKPKWLQMAKE